jgi:hypothetical protein
MLKHTLRILGFILILSMSSFSQDVMQYVGTIGGELSDLEVYQKDGRTYAYIAQGGGIVVYETTDPHNPRKLQCISAVTGLIYDLALGNGFLAAAMGEHGTYIYSLEDPEQLKLTSTIGATSRVIQASGYVVVIEGGYSGSSPGSSSHFIWTYSIQDIHHPFELDYKRYSGYRTNLPSYYVNHSVVSHDLSVFYYFRLFQLIPFGDWGFFRVTVDGNSYEDTHISAPITDLNPLGNYHKVLFRDDVVLAGNQKKLNIFDISNDNNTVLFEYPMVVEGKMLLDGDMAYIKSATDYCVLDISDINHINVKGRIELPSDPTSIVNNVAYSIESKNQLELQIIDGLSVDAASSNDNAIDNVFSMASSQDHIYTSEYKQVGDDYFSKINILNSNLDDLHLIEQISLDGYFPFLAVQNEWLLVDNSTKLRLYNVDDPTNPFMSWELDHPYDFPMYYEREPSFNKKYDLLFTFPYIIISYAKTLLIYEIVDNNTIVKRIEKNLDYRFTALHYNNGLLYGIRVKNYSGIGLAIFDLSQQEAPMIYQDEELLNSESSKQYGCITTIDNQLFLLNYNVQYYALYQYDINENNLIKKNTSIPNSYLIANVDNNLYLLSSRSLHYSFNVTPIEQKFYQVNIDDPMNLIITEISTLPPTIEPPLTQVGDYLLIPGREAGIFKFKLPVDSVSVEDWMLHGVD